MNPLKKGGKKMKYIIIAVIVFLICEGCVFFHVTKNERGIKNKFECFVEDHDCSGITILSTIGGIIAAVVASVL
jgi:hypothetical protein